MALEVIVSGGLPCCVATAVLAAAAPEIAALALHSDPVLRGWTIKLLWPGWDHMQGGDLYEGAALLVLLVLHRQIDPMQALLRTNACHSDDILHRQNLPPCTACGSTA